MIVSWEVALNETDQPTDLFNAAMAEIGLTFPAAYTPSHHWRLKNIGSIDLSLGGGEQNLAAAYTLSPGEVLDIDIPAGTRLFADNPNNPTTAATLAYLLIVEM